MNIRRQITENPTNNGGFPCFVLILVSAFSAWMSITAFTQGEPQPELGAFTAAIAIAAGLMTVVAAIFTGTRNIINTLNRQQEALNQK